MASAAPRTTTLRFRTHFWTAPGDHVRVVGSHAQLGGWAWERGAQLQWAGDGFWTGDVTMPSGESFEYKYVMVRRDFGGVEWEAGGNRSVLGAEGRLVWLVDAWQAPVVGPLASASLAHAVRPAGTAVVPPPAPGPEPGAAADDAVAVRFAVTALAASVSVRGSWAQWGAGEQMAAAGAGLWEAWARVPRSAFPLNYKYVADGDRFEEGADRSLPAPDALAERVLVSDGAFRGTWRAAGVAVPLFSVHSAGSYGCGDFADLKLLVDWAADAGLRMVQLLPINDTSVYGTWRDSYPYNPLSVFALHPLYLAPQQLLASLGLEGQQALPALGSPPPEGVDYEGVLAAKQQVLRDAFAARGAALLGSGEFEGFLLEHAHWLKPYAAFCALRDHYGTADFSQWAPEHERVRGDAELEAVLAAPQLRAAVEQAYFTQFHLHQQMLAASQHAASRRVALKGDLPIGVARWGVDAWYHREQFKLHKQVGAPPDYFATLGQNWSFPAYDWEAMSTDGFAWWRRRLQHLSRYFHAYRIDHILGFFRIWEIPAHGVTGLLGKFCPVPPLWRDELAARGVWDLDRLTQPYIRWWTLRDTFGEGWYEATRAYVVEGERGAFRMRPEFDTEKKIEAAVPDKWLAGQLYSLVHNVVLLHDDDHPGAAFHPRIEMQTTSSFRDLDAGAQAALKELYVDYFYQRPEQMWRESAMRKLPALVGATDMLVCGEDLGMIPDSVPGVMHELGVLSLRIQRMPADDAIEFGDTRDAAQYPYASVCATSTHDMAPLRAWYEADHDMAQRFLWHSARQGFAPQECTPDVARTVLYQHLEAESMLAVLPIQDLLAVSPALRAPDAAAEQINVPAIAQHYWRWRMHLSLEELQAAASFTDEVRGMVKRTGRSV